MIDAAKNKHRASIRPLDAATIGLTTFGLGFLRPAPGTWGSMPPPAIFALLCALGAGASVRDACLGVLLLASAAACVAFGRYAERRFGRKDAAEVVIDETAGQTIPLLLLPVEELSASAPGGSDLSRVVTGFALAAAAFILFRTFDILKPWPARRLESLPAGWGVLADDLMAGVYAAAVLHGAIIAFN